MKPDSNIAETVIAKSGPALNTRAGVCRNGAGNDQSKTLADLLFVRGVLGVLIDQVDSAVEKVAVGNKPIGAREMQSLKTAVTVAQSAIVDLVK